MTVKSFRKLLSYSVFLVPVAAVFLIWLELSKLTPAKLAQVKMGMNPDQVKSILGRPEESQVHGAVGLTSTTYLYRSGKSEIKVVFLNNRVMAVDGELKR